jgi:hypothetical protein
MVFTPPTVEGTGIGIRNTVEINFPQSPIDAGTVRFIGIFDSSTPGSGNMYLYGQLSEELPIMAGESPVLLVNEVLFFSIGGLSIAYKVNLFNVMRGISITGFTPHYSLWNGNPQDGGAELSGDNYARVPLTFSAPTVDASGMAIITNTTSGSFNRPTTDWGIATYEALINQGTAGVPVWFKQRLVSKPINRGIMPMIAANAITVGIN